MSEPLYPGRPPEIKVSWWGRLWLQFIVWRAKRRLKDDRPRKSWGVLDVGHEGGIGINGRGELHHDGFLNIQHASSTIYHKHEHVHVHKRRRHRRRPHGPRPGSVNAALLVACGAMLRYLVEECGLRGLFYGPDSRHYLDFDAVKLTIAEAEGREPAEGREIDLHYRQGQLWSAMAGFSGFEVLALMAGWFGWSAISVWGHGRTLWTWPPVPESPDSAGAETATSPAVENGPEKSPSQ